jgi:hypothetical protein
MPGPPFVSLQYVIVFDIGGLKKQAGSMRSPPG